MLHTGNINYKNHTTLLHLARIPKKLHIKKHSQTIQIQPLAENQLNIK